MKVQGHKVCLTGCKGAVIIKALGEEVLGRDSLQRNAQRGSEMWHFYSDTEDVALQRLLSCLGNKLS